MKRDWPWVFGLVVLGIVLVLLLRLEVMPLRENTNANNRSIYTLLERMDGVDRRLLKLEVDVESQKPRREEK